MANAERGGLSVTVGGKAYTLRPTFDALCELENMVGKPLHEVLDEILQRRISGLRAVVWCFMQDAHAADFPTLKDASLWIEQAGGVDKVMSMLNDVLGINAPTEKSKGKVGTGRPRKARAGTGKRSSLALADTA